MHGTLNSEISLRKGEGGGGKDLKPGIGLKGQKLTKEKEGFNPKRPFWGADKGGTGARGSRLALRVTGMNLERGGLSARVGRPGGKKKKNDHGRSCEKRGEKPSRTRGKAASFLLLGKTHLWKRADPRTVDKNRKGSKSSQNRCEQDQRGLKEGGLMKKSPRGVLSPGKNSREKKISH